MRNFRWQVGLVTLMLLALMVRVQAQPQNKAVLDATNAALKKMRDEKILPQKAWDDGLLTKDILLLALNADDLLDPGHGLWNLGEEASAWTQLLRDRLPELWKSPAGLGDTVQIRIALALSLEKDARSAEILENLLNKMPRQNPNIAIVNVVIRRLSNYYRSIGQNDKVIKTSLRIQEFTTDPMMLSNLLLGAARATYASGDKEGAQKLYDQVIGYGHGWVTGQAHSELAGHLFVEGKLEEGRTLLKKPIEGTSADQVRVLLNQRLTQSYFETGEWDLARQYAKATVDQYNSLAEPIKTQGLEWMVESAKSMPQQIDEWQKSPVRSFPDEINLRLKKDAVGPVHTYFNVNSYRSVKVKAASTDPDVKVWPLRDSSGYGDGKYQMLVVEIGAAAVAKNVKSEIVLTFEEFPDVTLRIPVITTIKEAPK